MNRKRTFALLGLALLCLLAPGCSIPTPTATFKSFYEAYRKNDIPTMKSSVTKGSIALGEQLAKAGEMTLDQWITTRGGDRRNLEAMPELRSEQITGETAALEIKPTYGENWITVMFVKEDGRWKIAFDQMWDQIKPLANPKP